MSNRARTIEHMRQARETALHGEPLSDEERVTFACQTAAKDAETWKRIRPEPQLELSDAT